MIVELGHFSLIIALLLSVAQIALPAVGVYKRNTLLMASCRSLAVGNWVFVTLACASLWYAFLNDDFSVMIVANHSNTLLPSFYKFSALWGGHEGSLLLWIYILAFWQLAVAIFSRQLPLDMLARVQVVMGFVSVGFLLFSLLTSSPFERKLPLVPIEGRDLNPLLQDIGMVIHPPMLYVGYVGFSVAFAFAVAALWSGRLDAAWARWCRPWTNIAWGFLSFGIALGSWWAYYELGWGGWWFWDPVENASFMPWLLGTALIHSLAVTEKRGLFKSWTVLLAIFTFSLSLLGTFLVRSGILTSVHSFAADPDRGIFILSFLAIVVGGSLTLFAFRAPTVSSKASFSWGSREMFLLVNNVIFLVATLTVLFGTLFPLIMDAFDLGKYSVGPPYFNAMFVPLMAILIAFMGVAPHALWKNTSQKLLKRKLTIAAVSSLLCGFIFPFVYGGSFNIWVVLTVIFAAWLIFSLLADFKEKIGLSGGVWRALKHLTFSYYGMLLAHFGMACCVIGVCLTTQYSLERDVKLMPGEKLSIAGYDFRLDKTYTINGPNFQGTEGQVSVMKSEKVISVLHPQKRRYHAQGSQVMTEAAISANLWRDLYVALGEPLGEGAWALRVHYKPFVRWMWLGGLLMFAGSLCTVLDKRYRRLTSKSAESKVTAKSVNEIPAGLAKSGGMD